MAKIADLVKKYKDDLAAVARLSSGSLATSVIDDTPVDKSDLKESWTPSINSLQARNVYPSQGDSFRHNYSIVDDLNLGDIFFFANGQPYARRIEYDGWSKYKSPQGMLRKNAAKWGSIVDKAILEAKNGV